MLSRQFTSRTYTTVQGPTSWRHVGEETQEVEYALEAAVEGKAENADEAVIASGSAPGSVNKLLLI